MDKKVPYIAFESEMARNERHVKRLSIALVVSLLVTFLSNALWLYAWCQYDYQGTNTETTYTQDGKGLNIIGDNNVTEQNGKSKDIQKDKKQWQITGN